MKLSGLCIQIRGALLEQKLFPCSRVPELWVGAAWRYTVFNQLPVRQGRLLNLIEYQRLKCVHEHKPV